MEVYRAILPRHRTLRRMLRRWRQFGCRRRPGRTLTSQGRWCWGQFLTNRLRLSQDAADEALNFGAARIGVPDFRPWLALRRRGREHDVFRGDPAAGGDRAEPGRHVGGDGGGAEDHGLALLPCRTEPPGGLSENPRRIEEGGREVVVGSSVLPHSQKLGPRVGAGMQAEIGGMGWFWIDCRVGEAAGRSGARSKPAAVYCEIAWEKWGRECV